MPQVVLVHGGGFDSRCWDLVLPLLNVPALAVDLPGRGRHPMPLGEVSLRACAAAVASDVDEAGFDDVVLVGHSLAGCSMPSIVDALGGRVRHAVFVACSVPPDGQSAFDTLDPEVQELIRAIGPDPEPRVMDGEIARLVLGNDLDEQQLAWCVERLVPEAPGLTREAVSLAPLDGVPATWLRTLQDLIIPPDKQTRFAGHIGGCEVVDVDAGHMCMVGQPATVARIVDRIAQLGQ